jgi:hypothetical protein
MANLTSTTITGTLNTTSTITGPASGASALNASNVSSGTLASDRLPTVPTTKGGTGLTSIGSAGQVLKVAAPGSALEFGDAGGGGDYVQRIYTSPATWTKPAGLKAVKVKVWGGGGAGGRGLRTVPGTKLGGAGGAGGFSEEYLPEASIPGPVSVTAGPGTNSYGAFLSATGGGNGSDGTNPGPGTNGTPGTGSGGQLNFPGEWYMREPDKGSASNFQTVDAGTYGFGVRGKTGNVSPSGLNPGQAGSGYQMGGGGGGSPNPANPLAALGGAGAPGAVIIEEYY